MEVRNMGFGVDTTDYLNQINWTDFCNWKGQYPGFAGRYFGGGYTWSGTEFTDAKASTGGVLSVIAPIRASTTGQSVSGSQGHANGVNGATDTCARITNAVNAGQLVLPAESVIVYLDNEPIGSNPNVLTSDYWAGWANTVNNFPFESRLPFVPGLYCTFATDSSGKWVPDSAMQAALNGAYKDYPSEDTVCAGTWTFQPHTPLADYCPAASVPDWSLIGDFKQGGSITVTTLAWQYVSPVACSPSYPNWAGGQPLDMDGSDSTGAETNMLRIS